MRAASADGGSSRAFADIGSHLCGLLEFLAGEGIFRLAVASAFAVLVFTDSAALPALILLSLMQGLAFAADNPARQLLVLDIVGRDRIASAVSMNEVVINASRIVGPAIAGILLVVADPGWCFVVNALSFLPALIVLATISAPPAETAESDTSNSTSAPSHDSPGTEPAARAVLRPGLPTAWRYVLATPAIRATLALAVGASASLNIAVVMPLMVSDVFDAGGGTYGAVAVAFGVGALPGALMSAAGSTEPRRSEVRALALSLSVLVVIAALPPVLPLLFVTVTLVGAASMWFIARANAFVILQSPVPIRGRMMGIWAMALPGSSVASGLIVGATADAFGPRAGYALVGLCLAITIIVGWRALRDR